MTTQLDSPRTRGGAADAAPAHQRRGRVLGVVALLVGVAFVAANARTGAVADRIANPDVTGAPRPVEPLFGFDHWIELHQIGTVLMMVALVAAVVIGWRRSPRHPVLLDGAGHHPARLAGPDHELGAVCGLQPATLALARDVAARFPVTDRRAVHRDRLRDLLHGAVLPGDLVAAAHAGPPAGRGVRLAASAPQPFRSHPRRSGSSSMRCSRRSSCARSSTSTPR